MPLPSAAGLAHEIRDGVLRLELARPERLNAVTTALLEELTEAVSSATANPAVRAIRLSGAGRGFCAGADIGASSDGTSIEAANAAVAALLGADVPVVAAVHGPAAGVGCSLALACDVVLMARSAYFLLAFTRIGLMPDGGATALVAASVGRARALRMSLLAERLPAPTAYDWGLVSGVHDDEALESEADTIAVRLATGAGRSLALTKHAVNAAVLGDLDAAFSREVAGQAELGRTRDFREGVAAFQERREPRFGG